MSKEDEDLENYKKYRGKCREMSEALVKENPELRLVRGHYFCPLWCSNEPHWWCVDKDGKIHDPTALQFPSRGSGIYEEFDGIIPCAECGAEVEETDATINGRYGFCSHRCAMRFVGL